MSTPPHQSPLRILVRSTNWLGDAVLSTPAMLRLRERFPDAAITLLTADKLADLWPGHPAVDSVIPFARGESAWSIASRLRPHRFDLALLFPNSPRSALEAWLARIPRRIGGSWPWRNALLTDVVPDHPGSVPMVRRTPREIRQILSRPDAPPNWGLPAPNSSAHHIHQYLRLLQPLGGNPAPLAPRIDVPPETLRLTRQRFDLDPAFRWIGLNAGAEFGPAKRWPVEHFQSLARQLAPLPGIGLILFGGPADVPLAHSIAQGLPGTVRILAGQTRLGELAAALQSCRMVVTNDTGPMHLAAAVGTPVVVPFGSTSPELTGPGLPGDPRHHLIKSKVPCGPCFLRTCPTDHRCLRDITPETVLQLVREHLTDG